MWFKHKPIDENSKITRSDPKFEDADEYGNTLINNQSTEILKSYSFWPLLEVHEKDHENIYEISSYTLNPGIIMTIKFEFYESGKNISDLELDNIDNTNVVSSKRPNRFQENGEP